MQKLAVLVMALVLAVPATAETIADPVVFVKGVYARWNASQPEPTGVFTARLDALAALDDKEAHGEVGRGDDFSFWCDCQDGELTNATVRGWPVYAAVPAREVVEVKFLLDGKKQDLLFYFEMTKAGWKLDDVQSIASDPWTLSLVYKYGWPDGK